MDKRIIIPLLALLLSLSLLSFSYAIGQVGEDDSEETDEDTGTDANEDDEETAEHSEQEQEDEDTAREGTSQPSREEELLSQSCGFFRHCPEGYGCFVFDGLGKRCGQPNPCSYFQCSDDKICEVRPPNLILGAPHVTCSEPESICSRLERLACSRNTHCAWEETKCVPGDETICPAVCIEMWEIRGNACILNECGSGCGPDNKKSFLSADECEAALPTYCNSGGQCKAYFSPCSCSWQCARETPEADCARACEEEDQGPAPACNCEGNECIVLPSESCEGFSRAECKRNDVCMWARETFLRGTCVNKPTPPVCGNNVCDKGMCIGDVCYPAETLQSCPRDCRAIACSMIACAAPPSGCRYGTPNKDENGCMIDCGKVICEQKCGNGVCEEGEADEPGGCGPNADPICLGPPARQGTCPRDCQTDPNPPGCTKEYMPVCGQPKKHPCCGGLNAPIDEQLNCDLIRVDCSEPKPKTYSNLCLLKNDGATLLYRGECKTSSCGNGVCEEGEADDPGGCGPNADPICLGPPARQGTCPRDCRAIACSMIACAAPPSGCRYGTPKYDENRCQINCGEVICETKGESFKSARWQCYNGETSSVSYDACYPIETLQAKAKHFCENKCNADKTKCGVNSFAPSNSCINEPSEGMYRFASWQCYDGTAERQGGETSCKPYGTWKQYAKDFCDNRCSQEFSGQKCGVNTFKVEKECRDQSDPSCPAVCKPLWEIKENLCKFNECGSGCGADGKSSFETRERCEVALENSILACRDSDGGKTYTSKGTVTFKDGTSKIDSCWDDGKTLTEYVCIQGVYQGDHSYICPHGCRDGACLSSTNQN